MLFWLVPIGLQAQTPDVRAWLDREQVYQGETAVLHIEAADMENVSLDTAPLQPDFEILTQQTGSHLRQVNGKITQKTRWTLHLLPRRSGILTLPPLTVGDGESPALVLRVADTPAPGVGDNDDLLLEVEAQPDDPYVQQQVLLTVRLLHAVPLLGGSLEEPEHPDLVVEKLGNEVTYRATRNKRNYNVIERRYAVFPEHSGRLTLPKLRFQGRISRNDRGTSFLLGRGQRRILESQPLPLEVKPRPDDYQGRHWLPAGTLTLREAWPQEPPSFTVGEPVTRRLILEARGLTASQLPDLDIPGVPGLRVYPDQPESNTSFDGGWVQGRRELAMALVPAKAGEFMLPEVRLRWWDTQADRERVAVLPQRAITVAPSPQQTAATAPTPTPTPQAPAPPVPRPSAGLPVADPGIWPWLSGGFLLLWLLTVAAWWRERRHGGAPRSTPPPPPDAGPARKALARACRTNDPRAAADALLDWATATWPDNPPATLGALARRLGSRGGPVRALDRYLYAANPGDWRGDELREALKEGLDAPSGRENAEKDPLPTLYPASQRPIP